jgi:hypothetical protein
MTHSFQVKPLGESHWVVLLGVVVVAAVRVEVFRRMEMERCRAAVVAVEAFAPVEMLDLHAAEALGELAELIDGGQE